jgi:hypothetical protein
MLLGKEITINMCLLQVNYKVEPSSESAGVDYTAIAEAIAAVPGLRWKIWLYNDANGEGGGIYLFEDRAALMAFVEGPMVEALKENPAFTGLSMKTFEVQDAMSRITRAPLAS